MLDSGFLKDQCGGVEISTSRKHEHQIRFETTFHPFLISNSDAPLNIQPNDVGVRAKRVGWRLMNRFADAGDPAIDDVTVFTAERGVRDLIGERYWIPMLRVLHELYHEVMQGGDTPRFDTTESEFAMEFPALTEARGIQYYVDLFEIYEPLRGEDGWGMQGIFLELKHSHNLPYTEEQFYATSFRALLVQKIDAYRAAHSIAGSGGPRFARQSSGGKKFFGVRLALDEEV